MMRQDRFTLTLTLTPALSRKRERAGVRARSSPQDAKMPNKLVEYPAAPFPLTLSLSKGERSHNLPLMVRQAHHERGRSRLRRRGGQAAHRPIQR